jgi:ATP-binding cassette, subfamily C, bacterial CydD
VRPLDPRLLRRAHAARRLLGADVAFGIATAILVLLQATLLARVIARSFDGASLDDVSTELLLLALLFGGRALLAWAFELAGRRAATGVLSQLRLELVEKRLRDEPVALDGVESAEIATLATHGIGPLEAYFGRFLPQVVLALVVPVAVLAWVIAIDVTSALVMVLTLPLVPVFMAVIGRYTERKARARAQALALLATRFLDVVRGLPTLRAFNRSRAQADSLARAGDDYRRTTMQTLRVAFVSGAVLELAATLGIALVAVTIGVRLVDGNIGFEAGLTVLLLAPELYLPLRSVAAQYHASADGLAVGERLLQLTETTEVAHAREDLASATSPNGSIVQLQGVSYAYPARPGRVLDDVDLELLPGETLVLVGSSGSGKSTLASIVLGLLEPSAGRVLRDGVEKEAETLTAWRQHVAWVPQRATLFTGTVADNIRLGDRDADHEHVRAAAGLAGAAAFVADLPDGYETVVGDGGRPLSAGEAQRIALARAFLRDARLVILDEPTANLDAANAEAVTDAMSRLSEGRTLLVIAHRPELARNADRIVRLEAGRLVEDRGVVGA